MEEFDAPVRATPVAGVISGIYPNERAYRLEDWKALIGPVEPNVSRIYNWQTDVVANLQIVGPPGTGKTGLGVSLLNDFKLRGFSSMIVRIPALMLGSFNERAAVVRDVSRVSAILLDDFHRIAWDRKGIPEWFHALTDAITGSQTRLIATSNASIRELRDVAVQITADYEPGFDRMRVGGMATIELLGESKRL